MVRHGGRGALSRIGRLAVVQLLPEGDGESGHLCVRVGQVGVVEVEHRPATRVAEDLRRHEIALAEGEVGVVNHYYLARLLEEQPDAPVGLVWAEQDGRGVHINTSGGGITRYADDVELGQQFLEWLATDGQDTLVVDNHEYPANPAVAAEPLIAERFGTDFVRDPLHADVLGSLNGAATEAMDSAGVG